MGGGGGGDGRALGGAGASVIGNGVRVVEGDDGGGGGGGGDVGVSEASVFARRRRLQVEERSLRLVGLQDSVRAGLVREQRELMALGERPYRKVVREGEKQRADLAKDEMKRARQEREAHFKAGAYTRPLFSSTSAVSDTKAHPEQPQYPMPPTEHTRNNPKLHPLSHRRRLS